MRVRSLTLCPPAVASTFPLLQVTTKSRKTFLKLPSGWKLPPRKTNTVQAPSITFNDVLRIVTNLKRVKRLTLQSVEDEEKQWTPQCIKILEHGWEAFGASLEVLKLNLPIRDIFHLPDRAVVPTTLLPNLFQVELDMVGPLPEGTVFQNSTLSAFLNRHASQLRSLSLFTGSLSVHLSDFIDSLDAFPYISDLSVYQSWSMVKTERSNPLQIHRFVEKKTPNASRFQLKLHPNQLNAFINQSNSSFHKFEVLHISTLYRAVDLPECDRADITQGLLKRYIPLHLETLVELDITGFLLPFPEFRQAIDLLASAKSLQVLGLCVSNLEPENFVYIARRLPDLHTLTLLFGRLKPVDHPPPPTMHPHLTHSLPTAQVSVSTTRSCKMLICLVSAETPSSSPRWRE